MKLNPSQLTVLLAAAIPARHNVLITGAPGIGKSDIVHAAAKAAGCELLLSHPAVQDPTAASGLPWIDGKGGATFLPFGNLALAIKATTPTLWFLDDLGQAAPAVQAAYMQLLLAREIDGQKISEHITFVAATNGRAQRSGVTGILEPVKSRFKTIVELEVDSASWRAWAMQAGIAPLVVAFLTYRPNLLCNFNPTAEMTNSPLPRTWAGVSDWLKCKLPDDVLLATLHGAVGEDAGNEFFTFMQNVENMPDPHKVLANAKDAPVPTDASILWALVTALAELAVKADCTAAYEACCIYTKKLVVAGFKEFGVVLIKDLLKRAPNAQNCRAFIELLTDRNIGLGELLA